VKAGSFREDLFTGSTSWNWNLPALRERPEDVLPAGNHFLAEFTQGKARLSSAVTAGLARYTWPGNVRELRNAMERAALLSRGELILPEHLPAAAAGGGGINRRRRKCRMRCGWRRSSGRRSCRACENISRTAPRQPRRWASAAAP